MFNFHSITMWLAEGWLGGIGKFPSHPSAKKIWIPHSRLRRSWEIHFLCLGIWREFSNTSSPSLHHSYISSILNPFWSGKSPGKGLFFGIFFDHFYLKGTVGSLWNFCHRHHNWIALFPQQNEKSRVFEQFPLLDMVYQWDCGFPELDRRPLLGVSSRQLTHFPKSFP